jgi:hypothetical protein
MGVCGLAVKEPAHQHHIITSIPGMQRNSLAVAYGFLPAYDSTHLVEPGAFACMQWKTVLWAAQYLLPELVAAARLLPPPALPSPSSPLAGASLPPHVLVTGSSVSSTSGRAGAAGHRPGPGGAPPASSSGAGEAAGVAELRTDLAQALSALASALGK